MEEKRQVVNRFVRQSGAYDAVIDFALRARPIHGRYFFRDLHISVGDSAAKVVPRQLEGHLSICNTHVGVMVHGFEVHDETVHEAE